MKEIERNQQIRDEDIWDMLKLTQVHPELLDEVIYATNERLSERNERIFDYYLAGYKMFFISTLFKLGGRATHQICRKIMVQLIDMAQNRNLFYKPK